MSGQGERGPRGERGPVGDQGEDGGWQRGAQGERGETGHTGHMGERGPTGDHGQDGQTGAAGEQGVPGHLSPYVFKAIAVTFACMMVVFLILGTQIQRNQGEIRDAQRELQSQQDKSRQMAYDSCVIRKTNVERINALYRGIIQIENHNPYVKVSPETVQARIDLYTSALLSPTPCGRKP